jgi:hypothetical protein
MDTQTGTVYKLTCKHSLKTYYGSTSGSIHNRLCEHVHKFNNGKRHGSADIIAGGNYSIEELEIIDYNDKKELREREKFYIQTDKNCVNKNIPNRTSNDWHAENSNYNKEYYQANKAKHQLYMKQYYLQKKGIVLETGVVEHI